MVSVTPVFGTGIPMNHVPSNVQTLRSSQIDSDHVDTLTALVDRHFASVSLADTEGNPFQQDLIARGFTASPVLGTPQGLAVYQNGVRINEAFGDTVLWDFIPIFAVEELQEMPGSNPVFGLNALGGAVTLKMKNGFDAPAGEAEVAAGLFDRERVTAQTGIDMGDSAIYIGAKASHDGGWRQRSPSDSVQSFADYMFRGERYQLGASLTLASSYLNGNGADPAQDDRTAAFAIPDTERNNLILIQARAADSVTDALTLHGTAYFRHVHLKIQNGGASDFDAVRAERVRRFRPARGFERPANIIRRCLLRSGAYADYAYVGPRRGSSGDGRPSIWRLQQHRQLWCQFRSGAHGFQ